MCIRDLLGGNRKEEEIVNQSGKQRNLQLIA